MRLTPDQMMYCSTDCLRDYVIKRRNFHNKYSSKIKEHNLEFQERMRQMKENEYFLGRY